jgi:biopolymer transport protein ExbD
MKKPLKKVEMGMELNLTPMMNLFVALIPFLLMSSSFMHYGTVDVTAPSKAAEGTAAAKTDELWLEVIVHPQEVLVRAHSKDYESEYEAYRKSFAHTEMTQLVAHLQKMKADHATWGPSLFHASPETRYEQAVNVLSRLRAFDQTSSVVLAMGVRE